MNFEIRPIRCFTCGSLINCYQDRYQSLIESGVSVSEALDSLEFKHPCCRTAMMIPVLYPYVTLNETKLYGSAKPVTKVNPPKTASNDLSFQAVSTSDGLDFPTLDGLSAVDEYQQKKPTAFSEPVIDLNHLTIRKNDGTSVSIPVSQRSKWTVLEA